MGALANFQRLMNRLTDAVIHGATSCANGLDSRGGSLGRHSHKIEELTAARESAERASDAKSAFLAKMSQEMRAPLNALLSYAEILLEKAQLAGRGEEVADLQKIDAAGRRLACMLDDILDISRIEHGKMPPHRDDVGKDEQTTVPAVLHSGPSADEKAFLDEAEAEDRADRFLQSGDSGPGETVGLERLLVVDDDRNFLDLAERLFLKEGYSPICTDAPQSALQIARTVRPTAIFLDVLMPGFDGWDVLAALKSDPATAGIAVFMISSPSERARARAAGADGVVMKPLNAAQVKAAIAGLWATRGSSKTAGRNAGAPSFEFNER